MTLKREPTRGSAPVNYPTLDELRTNRRLFLQALGGSALAALGLAACETAGETGVDSQVGGGGDAGLDALSLPDATPPPPGTMVIDDIEEHRPDVPAPPPDIEEPPLPGEPIEPPPDIQEPDIGGDMPAPDIIEPPPDIQEPPIGGDMPAPDIVESPDVQSAPEVEEPPIDGDMPAPEER